MQTVTISLTQVSQVQDFVNLVNQFPFDVDMVSGRYTVNAKSMLGIYSLDLRSCTNSRSMQTCEEKLPVARQKTAGILCVFQDFLTQPGGNLGRKDVCWGLLVQLLSKPLQVLIYSDDCGELKSALKAFSEM